MLRVAKIAVFILVVVFAALSFAQDSSLDAHASAPNDASASPATTFRVIVEVVTFDAAVLDRKTGRAVAPLTPHDFVVYEDGVPQHVSYFSQDALPLSVVLLFDLTDSVRPVLESLAKGALAALNHLKPQDEVAVMVYAASATLLQDFTTDRALAAAAITKASKMKSDEAAFFNEGLYQAAQQTTRSRNPNTRRVIIWLTDNVPNFPSDEIRRRYAPSLAGKSPHTERQALDALFKDGPMVCALVERSLISDEETMSHNAHWADYMLERHQFPPGDVYRYAEQTGGEVAESNARHMPEKLATMIDSLRARYTLGFRPSSSESASSNDSKLRELRVRLTPEAEHRFGRVNVVAKQGYYR
jgi:VWFA-related protein